jgi:hypothetical protein
MSPSNDPGLHSLVSWMAWHMENRDPILRTRLTDAGVLLAARQRVPGYSQVEYQAAIGMARQGVENANRANVLGQDDPLSAALQGAAPPSPTVTVRVLANLPGPTGQVGPVSLRVNVPWNATMAEVEEAWRAEWDAARNLSVGLAPAYGPSDEDEGWTIVGPLLFRDRDV